MQKPWPPASPAEALCRSVCNEYREWLQVQRGLAKASIRALMWEGRNFLSWYVARSPLDDLRKLNVRDIGSYFEMRAAGLRRRRRARSGRLDQRVQAAAFRRQARKDSCEGPFIVNLGNLSSEAEIP